MASAMGRLTGSVVSFSISRSSGSDPAAAAILPCTGALSRLEFPAPGGLPAPVSGPTSPFPRHTGCALLRSLPRARSRPKRGTRGRLPANMAGGTLLRKEWAGCPPSAYSAFRNAAPVCGLLAPRRFPPFRFPLPGDELLDALSTPEGPAPWSFGVSGAGWVPESPV